MKYLLEARDLGRIGIVGSDGMGFELASFFARALGRYGVNVVVVDDSDKKSEAARDRLDHSLKKGVESGKLKEKIAASIRSTITFTTDIQPLAGAGLVIAGEEKSLDGTRALVARLESVCPASAILAVNSSHEVPEEIFSGANAAERCLVLKTCAPADRNPLVEVVPHGGTGKPVMAFLIRLLEETGKIPITVGSRYGYALGPVRDGLLQAAAAIVNRGGTSVQQVDAVACKALRLKSGPFTTANRSRSTAVTAAALGEMKTRLMPWFGASDLLTEHAASGSLWETAAQEETVAYDDALMARVSEQLLGAYFGLVSQVLESGAVTLADLELAVETGLGMGAPFTMMNRMGVDRALELVKQFAAANPGFPVPAVLERQAACGKPWIIPVVLRHDTAGVSVVTIRRPKALNALNADVIDQLVETFTSIRDDANVKAVVLTGFGNRAFVAGADIGGLARLQSAGEGEQLSLTGQRAFSLIEDLGKPVVCAMNGLAFGGGNELAMSCHARLAVKGNPVLAGQPEPKLGLIPGYGGTQRLPRLVGVNNAWALLRIGDPISSAQALEMGLIREEVEGDLLAAAIELAKRAAAGDVSLPPIPREKIEVPESLPELDLEHLSTKIDEFVKEATITGAGGSLTEGLALEARLFGLCFETKDARIGLENFLTNGPRAKAEFVNE